MNYLERSKAIKNEIIESRRFLHQNPEVGMELPNAVKFIVAKLTEMGYNPVKMGPSGVLATVGNGNGKTFLLRADMDALPMVEESDLEFASKNGAFHGCGHDMHAAMLLGAAKLLKENEANINGTIKLMFQPGEEVFKGAKSMIDAGILENPKVDASFAIHTAGGNTPVGIYMYNNSSTMMCSADTFKITVKGFGAHGSYPNHSIDPINIAAHIVIALEEIIARETDPSRQCILTIGSINAGTAPNIIPETAELQGSIRSNDEKMRELIINRIKEIAESTAKTFRGSATVEMLSGTPSLVCDKDITDAMVKYIEELPINSKYPVPNLQTNASEDYAEITSRVPSSYMMIGAGFANSANAATNHNPKVIFNEDALPVGAAMLAHCATRWLEDNK